MSVQEIKLQIERLSVDELLQLESFLKARRVAETPGFRARIEQAHARMDRDEAVSAAELRALLAKQHPAAS